MATKYIHVKKPPRNFIEKKKDFSRQGSVLSKQANINNIAYQSSKDMSKINVLNFQSIFEYLYPHSIRKPVKSERKYFKSVSEMEVSQLKNKIQLQNKKREQKSLKSLLHSHLRSKSQRTQNKSQNERQKSFTKRLLTKTQSVPQQKQTEKNQQICSSLQKQRKLLQSTNFSIRAISYLSNSQLKHQGKKKLNTSSILTKKAQTKDSSNVYFQSTNRTYQEQNLRITQASNLQNNEPQMDIKLSIKSMTKSEDGEAVLKVQDDLQDHMDQKQNPKIKKFEKQLISGKDSQRQIKNPFKPRSNKYNHMLIRFDKRLLLSANQINDPCLKIEKIKSITSRTLTEPNF